MLCTAILPFLARKWSWKTERAAMTEKNHAVTLSWKSLKSLKAIKREIVVPNYARPSKESDLVICHIGVGGFHRAHQAVYCDDLLTNEKGSSQRWCIFGIGLLDADKYMSEALHSQECLYTVLSQSETHEEARIIGSIVDYVWAYPTRGLQLALEMLSSPQTRIVSLTVTEKGYCQNISSPGKIDLNHPLIKHDLAYPHVPESAIGLVTAGLKLRKEREMKPFTVMSCDNLQENGTMLRALVIDYANQMNPDLADWIARNVSFPNSMVDRITPATEKSHKTYLKSVYKIDDKWPVVTEQFRQWVIEEKFCSGRPLWEKVGATFVKDVRPFELMKIRLLNGSHSALAYAAYLMGFQFVPDAMADGSLEQFVREFMNEVGISLNPIEDVSQDDYKALLIQRFKNPKIKDTILRLAMDGSSKALNSWQNPILELSARGIPLQNMAFALACWVRFMAGFDEQNKIIPVNDPLKEILVPIAAGIVKEPSGFREPKPFFELSVPNIADIPPLMAQVKLALEAICDHGISEVLRARYEI